MLCWQDQAEAAQTIVASLLGGDGPPVTLLPHGARRAMPGLDAMTTAARWLDGWRGGLLQTTPHDAGYFAKSIAAVARAARAERVLLVDPSAALLDPGLNDALIARAVEKPGHDLYFTPAAPGLVGLLLSRRLVDGLAAAEGTPAHPGRYLHYRPESPCLDPIAADFCCHAPTRVARSLHDFRADCDEKTRWLEQVHAALGESASAGGFPSAEAAVLAADATTHPRPPRDVTLEVTTRRATRPIWLTTPQADLLPHDLNRAVASLADLKTDDLRLTLGGRGDPLCVAGWAGVLDAARDAGVATTHVETDLLCDAATVARVAQLADVVSVHLPAVTAATYAAVMGVDGFETAKQNLARLIAAGRALVVPTFVKCRANLAEMEAWYDAWLATAGSAVVRGPDAFGHAAPEGVAAATMIRSERIGRELKILADGTLADAQNRPLGRLGRTPYPRSLKAA